MPNKSVYVGDEVTGLATDVNQKPEKVVKITTGFFPMGLDNLVVGLQGEKGHHEMYLCHVKLSKRNPHNTELFKAGKPLYIGDTVEVVDEKHPRHTAQGEIRCIYENCGLMYEVRDMAHIREFSEAQGKWGRTLKAEREKKLNEPGAFEKFLAEFKKQKDIKTSDPKLDKMLIEQLALKDVHEMIVGQSVLDKEANLSGYSEYTQAVEKWNKESIIYAKLDSLKLIKKFEYSDFKI
jgi:hypothetical protein